MSPTAGDSVPVLFSVMSFTDLLKLPAAKAFAAACEAGKEEAYGQAFLLAVRISSLEGGNLELFSFSTDVAKDHFTRLASGSTVERSTPGSRMLQSLDQRKISAGQQDLKALCSLCCQYVWLLLRFLVTQKPMPRQCKGSASSSDHMCRTACPRANLQSAFQRSTASDSSSSLLKKEASSMTYLNFLAWGISVPALPS